jgi:hypothetical protein
VEGADLENAPAVSPEPGDETGAETANTPESASEEDKGANLKNESSPSSPDSPQKQQPNPDNPI